MKNLTTGLSSTQQELDVLSQNLTYSKASQTEWSKKHMEIIERFRRKDS